MCMVRSVKNERNILKNPKTPFRINGVPPYFDSTERAFSGGSATLPSTEAGKDWEREKMSDSGSEVNAGQDSRAYHL